MNRRLSYSVEIMADQLIVAVTGKGTHCLGGCRRWLTSQAAMRPCNEAKIVLGSEPCDEAKTYFSKSFTSLVM
jgi:hypothetical protein